MPGDDTQPTPAHLPGPREGVTARPAPGDDALGPAATDGRVDGERVQRLLAGDATAFMEIVDGWSPVMLQVARSHVSTEASAEEVVQDTWLAVVRGLDRFEGRSSLRSWVFRILTNLAKTRGVREPRTVPWSSLTTAEEGPTVDPDRFRGDGEEWAHHWTTVGGPSRGSPRPSTRRSPRKTEPSWGPRSASCPSANAPSSACATCTACLPRRSSDALGVSGVNQRVLLHRARARLRLALEEFYRGVSVGVS